jgi:transposase
VELHYITEIINLQGIEVVELNFESDELVKAVINPTEYVQDCPCCGSHHVIRNGKDGFKNIRHLDISGKKTILVVPRIRMRCKDCGAAFAYSYEFVCGKERYTKKFKAEAYKCAVGSTVVNSADITKSPYSTIERFFKEIVMKLAPLTEEYAQKLASKAANLILGIDDFAVRKGHNYNTGFHDLRNGTILAAAEGRKVDESAEFIKNNSQVKNMQPLAVVMDLAKGYHKFASEVFPNAVRIADRFHVNGYILDAVNEVRRRIRNDSAPQAKLKLTQYKHVINKRNDSLNKDEKIILETLLSYSDELKNVYEFKESLIEWYDCTPNYAVAHGGFQKWLAKGHSLYIPEVETALKTFENWQDEIVNYHKYHFTNAQVEGRNGKIKSLQRRRYFLQNRTYYEAIILLECNKEISEALFKMHIA